MLKDFKIWLVGLVGAFVLSFVRLTISLRIVDKNKLLTEIASRRPVIAAFWHRQQLMMPWLYLQGLPRKKRLPLYVLISKSQDGRFIAKAVSFLGIRSVAGSSSKGGTEALLQLNRLINQGSHVTFTPDGPRGPVFKAKSGAVLLASNSGAPIICVGFAASSYWTFGSWDKMILPKPFSKAVMYIGDLLNVPADRSDLQIEEWQQILENSLNAATEQAQSMV